MADNIQYEIIDRLGVLSTSKNGWTKEVNLIAWNGRDPKYDIREWSPDHEKMSKGLTFNIDEAKALRDMLQVSLKEV